jgi:hypothetical protein
MAAVKHMGLFGVSRCRRTAQREEFDGVLFLNEDRSISEIATSNIGFVRSGNIVWPRSEWPTGITMTLLRSPGSPVAKNRRAWFAIPDQADQHERCRA